MEERQKIENDRTLWYVDGAQRKNIQTNSELRRESIYYKFGVLKSNGYQHKLSNKIMEKRNCKKKKNPAI